MNLLKNLKRVALALVLTLMFTNLAQANNANVIVENNTIDIEYAIADSSIDAEMDVLFMSLDLDCEEFKDGKWKERWRQFRDGFLDGLSDGLGSVANGGGNNGSGFNENDIQVMANFAINTLGNRDAYADFEYELFELINADSQYITADQLSDVFKNDQEIFNVYKNAIDKDGEDFPLDKVASKRGPWGKIGYILGRIAAIFILNELP